MTPETCNSPDTPSNISGTEEAQAVNVALANAFAIYTVEEDENYVQLSTFGQLVAYWPIGSAQGIALMKLEAERQASTTALPQDVAEVVDRLREGVKSCDETDDGELFDIDEAETAMDQAASLILSQSSTIASAREVIEQLLPAAETVLAGLDARIDEATAKGGTAVPVFNGIADLHDAIGAAREWKGR